MSRAGARELSIKKSPPPAVPWVRRELRSCGWSRYSGKTPPTGHPYRAAKQRPRVACRVSSENPGEVAFGSEIGVFLAAEVSTRGRFGSAPTQPRMRRIESTRSETHRFSKKTPPHATITRCRRSGHIKSSGVYLCPEESITVLLMNILSKFGCGLTCYQHPL